MAPVPQAAAAAAPGAAPTDTEEEKIADAKEVLGSACTGAKAPYKEEIAAAQDWNAVVEAIATHWSRDEVRDLVVDLGTELTGTQKRRLSKEGFLSALNVSRFGISE